MIKKYFTQEQFKILLDSFQEATIKGHFSERIPYEIWRKLKKASGVTVMVDNKCTITIIPNEGTPENYKTYDRGFGAFLYWQIQDPDLTSKNNIKENDTMKMPTMNFDFGPFAEPGIVALSPYGIAVHSFDDKYLTYNATTGATVDVTGFTFDLPKMIYKMPAAIKDLRAGDMVLHRTRLVYVQSVEEDGIHCIDILASEAKVVVPVTSIFGFNYVTKVISLMNVNAGAPSADNPFGNLMPFMMMSSVMGDDSDNDFSKMMMMSMMMGGSNPFTAMFNADSKV